MVHGSDSNGIVVITQLDPITVLFTIPQDTLPRVIARLKSGDKLPVEAWDREQKTMLARGALATTDNQIDVSTGTVRLRAQFRQRRAAKLFPNQFVNVTHDRGHAARRGARSPRPRSSAPRRAPSSTW